MYSKVHTDVRAPVTAEVDEVRVGTPVASSLPAGGKEIMRLGRVNPVLPAVAISSSPVLAWHSHVNTMINNANFENLRHLKGIKISNLKTQNMYF